MWIWSKLRNNRISHDCAPQSALTQNEHPHKDYCERPRTVYHQIDGKKPTEPGELLAPLPLGSGSDEYHGRGTDKTAANSSHPRRNHVILTLLLSW